MDQPAIISAILSGFFALLSAAIAAVMTVTAARHRAGVEEKLARLRGEIEAAAAQRRVAVDKELANLRSEFEVELANLAESSQIRLKIADGRLPAYKALWQCMTPVSPTASVPLSRQVRSDLDGALRKAFYDEGGGLLLSHAALSKYLEAVDVLRDEQREDATVRQIFSKLRTQMKKDLSIYTEDEAKRSVRSSPEFREGSESSVSGRTP